MAQTDIRIDEKIEGAPAFAQPIMRHLRDLVHQACPDVEETIKWSSAFFLYRGKMLCAIGVFKQHCSFGFFGPEMAATLRADGALVEDSAGSIGRITDIAELPGDKQMLRWIRQAMQIAASEAPPKRPAKVPKPAPETPSDLVAALKRKPGAGKIFDGFSPSCRREYVDWINEAKRSETRERRLTQAVEWIAEGKARNWKYENC